MVLEVEKLEIALHWQEVCRSISKLNEFASAQEIQVVDHNCTDLYRVLKHFRARVQIFEGISFNLEIYDLAQNLLTKPRRFIEKMAPYKYLSSAALLSLLFLIILSAQLAVSQNVLQWEKLNIVGSSPKARMDSVIGFDSSRNRVIVFGGRSSAEVFADTWILDISTRQWIKANDTLVNSLTIPGPRYGATFGTHKDRLIVAFGKGATKSAVSNEVYSFDYNSTTWSLVATNNANPGKRHFAAGGVTGDNLFATHGYDESSLKSDLYKLDLKSSRWEKLHDEVNQYSPVLPHARYLHGGAVLPGNKMLIFGGCLRYLFEMTKL